MRTSRRYMIKLGLCATASLLTSLEGLSGRVAHAAMPGEPAANEDGVWLRRDMFEAELNTSFVVRAATGAITVRLVRVADLPSARTAGTVNHPECFMVEFRGSRSSPLAQGTYAVENATLGRFPLFLVPLSTSTTHITYTATFNRMEAV